jgi:uncharacterized protein YbcI
VPDAATVQLAQDLLAIHEDSYGTTVGDVRVHLLDDDVIVILDGLELQRNEEYLIEKGREDLVLAIRSGFQQSIETTFKAAVERATGRTVTAFLSTTNLEPPFAVEIFRLAPRQPPPTEHP